MSLALERQVKVHSLSEESETPLALTVLPLEAAVVVAFGVGLLGQIHMGLAAEGPGQLPLVCVFQGKRLMDSKTPMRLALVVEVEALALRLLARVAERDSHQAFQGQLSPMELVGQAATEPPMEPRTLVLEAEGRVPILVPLALAVQES